MSLPCPPSLPPSLPQLIHEVAEENGGVVISFPRSGSASDKVTLKGARQCVESARARISEVVQELVSVGDCVATVTCSATGRPL